MTKLPFEEGGRGAVTDSLKHSSTKDDKAANDQIKRVAIDDDTVFVFVMDNSNKLRSAMPTFQTLVRAPQSELQGQAVTQLLGEVPQVVLEEAQQALNQELPWRGILPVRTKRGMRWFDVFVRATYRAGRVAGSQ